MQLSQWTKKALFGFSALTLGMSAGMSALSMMAQADEASQTRPTIEVGAGVQSYGNGANVLLKLTFGVAHRDGPIPPGMVNGPTEQLVLAHLTAAASINVSGEGPQLPYLDIHFSPFLNQTILSEEDGNIVFGNLHLLPLQISRNISIDQNLMVKVSVVGAEIGTEQVLGQAVSVYAQAAADLLGYKMASHLSGESVFHGIHIASAGAEGGLVFRITKGFGMRLSFGGNADINWWGTRFESDMEAYTAIRADITQFVQIFAKAGINGFWDSANSFRGGPQLMVGVSGIY